MSVKEVEKKCKEFALLKENILFGDVPNITYLHVRLEDGYIYVVFYPNFNYIYDEYSIGLEESDLLLTKEDFIKKYKEIRNKNENAKNITDKVRKIITILEQKEIEEREIQILKNKFYQRTIYEKNNFNC